MRPPPGILSLGAGADESDRRWGADIADATARGLLQSDGDPWNLLDAMTTTPLLSAPARPDAKAKKKTLKRKIRQPAAARAPPRAREAYRDYEQMQL